MTFVAFAFLKSNNEVNGFVTSGFCSSFGGIETGPSILSTISLNPRAAFPVTAPIPLVINPGQNAGPNAPRGRAARGNCADRYFKAVSVAESSSRNEVVDSVGFVLRPIGHVCDCLGAPAPPVVLPSSETRARLGDYLRDKLARSSRKSVGPIKSPQTGLGHPRVVPVVHLLAKLELLLPSFLLLLPLYILP